MQYLENVKEWRCCSEVDIYVEFMNYVGVVKVGITSQIITLQAGFWVICWKLGHFVLADESVGK